MLSKLEFFKLGGSRVPDVEPQALQEALSRHLLPTCALSVRPASGGTLGVCFHLDVAGARRFVKTHLHGERARANLTKEADILRQLYGEAVVLDCLEVRPQAGTPRLCLLMAELSHLQEPMTAEDAAAMVRTYTERLQGYRRADLAVGWDFEHYLTHGRRAIADLWDRRLIERQTAAELERYLELLHCKLGALPRALCHGDLGPKNILTDGFQPVAIDWEDAFWGIAGYDYLYWLTFMENRPFLRSSAFGRTGLDPAVERAILALVVLLKSCLAVLSGAYLQHRIPIETRITEVLNLPHAT